MKGKTDQKMMLEDSVLGTFSTKDQIPNMEGFMESNSNLELRDIGHNLRIIILTIYLLMK